MIFLMDVGYIYFTFQIDICNSATKRWGHSQSFVRMGPHCVWLVITGGRNESDVDITDYNVGTLIELGKLSSK